MREIIILGSFAVCMIPMAFAQTTGPSTEQQWKKLETLVQENGGTVGFNARDTEGNIILARNDRQNFIPASSIKLLTALAAIQLLGENYRFKSELYSTGEVVQGILQGDVYIVGGGDPSLLSKYFPDLNPIAGWVAAIKKSSIREIQGSIIGVDTHFKGYPLSFGVSMEDVGNYYGCGAWGLNAFDNSVPVFLHSGEPGTTFQVITPEDFSGTNYTAQGTAEKQSSDEAFVLGMPGLFERVIEGTMPANIKGFQIDASMPDPALYLARYLTSELKKSGINVLKEAASLRDPFPSASVMADPVLSPKLSSLCEVMLRESHNLFADAIFREMSVWRAMDGTYSSAADVFKEVCGLPLRAKIMDGSGLSCQNFLCPYDFSKALHRLSTAEEFSPPRGLKVETLTNGTVLHYKTGTMRNVRAISGYINSAEKGWQCFSIMANGFDENGADIRRQMLAFLRAYFGGA
jgi:D-alanyl-D-alanine carboxypeptidase/D-alanyl-D-alanine-endopeptidase (penicillin-binding protein 4)